MPRYIAALAITLFAGSTFAAPPGVRHIRADAAPGGDGLTWATAYNDLRQALITAGASGGAITELWVKQGTYLPGPAGSTDSTRSFRLVNFVGVYGGFTGTETERHQRNPDPSLTTLSGVLSPTVRVHNVVIAAGNDSTTLDGFTVTGGFAAATSTSSDGWAGAGIRIFGTPTISNCIITGNEMLVVHSSDNLFRRGAGVYCSPGSGAKLIDCIISDNHTNDCDSGAGAASAGAGGGLAVENGSVYLLRCTISKNTTGDGGYTICSGGSPGGGAKGGPGGGIYVSAASITLENCIVSDNITGSATKPTTCGATGSTTKPGQPSGHGGGIYSTGLSAVGATNTLFIGNRTGDGGPGGDVSSSVSAARGGDAGNGAAVYIGGGSARLTNCTFFGNIPGAGGPGGSSPGGPGPSGLPGTGAGVFSSTFTARIQSCIIWNDSATEIVGSTAFVAYSDIHGGFPGDGNIDADPRFVDAAGGDYRLSSTSPCIDAGNSDPVGTTLPATDLAGLTRRVDIATVPDTGVGAPVVDMGVYEVQAPCLVDLNGDGFVDFSDYLEFLNLFDAGDLRVDFTGDGIVDFSDYLEFLNLFEAGC